MGAYDTRGGTPPSPPNEERPLSAKDFRDMILNVVNAEPSLGNTCTSPKPNALAMCRATLMDLEFISHLKAASASP